MKKVYGIVGHPVVHSLSPAMHTAGFKAAGVEAEYRLFDIDPGNLELLANFCYETEINGIGGFSVTLPYKQAIMTYLDHYDPLAKTIGAVNTVAIETDPNTKAPILIGYNTDATGAMAALAEKIKLPGKRVLMMGAGGAGRAIIYCLKQYGADVHVFNRDMEKAEKIADEFDVNSIEYRLIKKESRFDVIINATSVGMSPNITESLLHAEQIQAGSLVMELVTSPLNTQLLREAKKAGAEIISGERMLLHQAVGQFEIWFGGVAPLETMEKALYLELEKREEAN